MVAAVALTGLGFRIHCRPRALPWACMFHAFGVDGFAAPALE